MTQSINIPSNSDWSTQTVTLDGNLYEIELKYKERTERWYLTLRNTEGEDLLTEKKCVGGQTLTGLHGIPLFGGNLYIERKFGKGDYPSHDDFGPGKAFELLYFTDAEYTALLKLDDIPMKAEEVI
ncbi:phage baseplate plug family protein [Enterobacter mori]